MRRFLSFWWLCARTAFWGNSAFANDWQWVFGNPLASAFGGAILAALGGFAPTIAKWLGVTEMTTGVPTLDSFLGALAAFAITWLVAFIVRILYAPVVLFFEQKNRADKLEGISPAAILSKRRRPIAVLHARYITNKTSIQRQALDYEADSLQAIQDLHVIFDGLTVETNDMTRLMHQSNRKINSAKDPQKKRQAVKKLADHLNSYSDRVEEFAVIIRGMTPTMLECTGAFLERAAPNVDGATLNAFVAALDGTVESIVKNVESASGAAGNISANFKGITHDLNAATARLEAVMEAYKASLSEYLAACGQIRTLANEKFDNGKTKLAEAPI